MTQNPISNHRERLEELWARNWQTTRHYENPLKRLKNRKLLFAILTGLFFCLHYCQADSVDDYVQMQMREHHIPGLSLAVMRSGQLVKTKGYGHANLEWQVPATEQTVFEIGSLTKQFTAALVLMLAQEGALKLDDKLKQHLDGVPAAWDRITLRHLLNHTSGLKNYTGLPGFEVRQKLKSAEFINRLAGYPLEFSPGDNFAYCNSGYNLLGYVLEKRSGMGYWELLQGRILGPLQMKATCSRNQSTIIPQRASGYQLEKQHLLNRDPDLTDVFAAGAMVSTVPDLVKWCAALEQEQLLKKPWRELLYEPARLNGGKSYPYGFGWRLGEYHGQRSVSHSGSTAGFSSAILRFPDKQLTIIVLCNRHEQNPASLLALGVGDICLKGEFIQQTGSTQ